MPLPVRRLIGSPAVPLTGDESRALRAALGLERRHVAALADQMRLAEGPVDSDRVVAWERSKVAGYPMALVEVLWLLETAVEAMGALLAAEAPAIDPPAPARLLLRPRGSRRIFQMLGLGTFKGFHMPEAVIEALDKDGGQFWQALTDQAVTRAALALTTAGATVHVGRDQTVAND